MPSLPSPPLPHSSLQRLLGCNLKNPVSKIFHPLILIKPDAEIEISDLWDGELLFFHQIWPDFYYY